MQVAILLYPGMTTLDAIGPYEVLRFMPECKIRFVSEQPGPIVTDSGVLVLGATHSYEETQTPDVIVVPGSEAHTATAMADRKLISWLKLAHQSSQYTLSVCSGALVLGAAGILEGHPATTHWIAQDKLRAFGARSRPDERIVQSGKVMTAAGVSAGIDLALTLAAEVHGRERAERIQLLMEYDPQPPFDAGHPRKASETVLAKAREEMLARSRNPRNLISVPRILWRRTLDRIRGK
ncbi:DJ-1/PfpI family protein [Wenzhouxiangella sp. AB-CW3]|uniref:DJ-1/PfpI family protein n=1 Tax=Wenzhouxiangella sp. AB-CW3 TaxID=2771012 RepID=UPI00168B7BCA|nr:DJ-1/PfpI family protein [Wenzhouxiangella sp. AB-CW3]QOC23910.1 DJ-1/PfpI family protein [Wenzhouxiangella sp. AB-CW3]